MPRRRDRAHRRSATASASSTRTPATTPTAITRLMEKEPTPGMPVRRTSSPAGRIDAGVTARDEAADGVATVVEAAGEGVSAADWPAEAVGQKSISWPADSLPGSKISALDSAAGGTSPPAISTVLDSKVAVCSQRAWAHAAGRRPAICCRVVNLRARQPDLLAADRGAAASDQDPTVGKTGR